MKPAEMKQYQKRLDLIKWGGVLLIVVALIIGNFAFASLAVPVRTTLIIVFGLLALLIALTTAKGKWGWQFLKEARIELRKVVWPTRQETVQTGLMIGGIVCIVALILWGVDSLFAYLVSTLLI